MKKIIEFVKSETVLAVSAVLAVVSMFLVPPSADYIDYIDFRTLGLLFCLMVIMAGLRSLGVFSLIGHKLLKKAASTRKLSLLMVLLCFFSSMLITNDVALITFVPFAIEVFGISGKKDKLALVVVLQTIAANLGSMLTPLGNPQNLYLYSLTGMGIGEFVLIMLPYTALSLVLLVACVFIGKDEKISFTMEKSSITLNRKLTSFYIILFALCLLTVVRLIPWYITLAILVVAVLAADGRTLLKADYNLLLMFVCFFIFVGNMGKLDIIKDFLTGIIAGNECLVSVAASQVISNVPAALLLSGFTENLRDILIGVNLGGLGTLIASMASLISYKFFAASFNKEKGKYMLIFTAYNIAFFAALMILYIIIK